LFFSGAAGGQFDRRARPAPLKNKKKEGGGRAGAINRPPLTGLSQLAGGKNGGRTPGGHALDSVDFQGISQCMIRLTQICSEKIWVMTRASARCKKPPGALQPFQRFGRERGKPSKRRIYAAGRRALAASTAFQPGASVNC
jgi:hypothetical protein